MTLKYANLIYCRNELYYCLLTFKIIVLYEMY